MQPDYEKANDEKGIYGWIVRAGAVITLLITLLGGLIGVYQFIGGQGITLLGGRSSAASTTPNVSATISTIVYQNTLTAPTSDWETDESCFFDSDGFHVRPNRACPTPVDQSDVDVSVQMKQISGTPTNLNGIEIRRSGRDSASMYGFDIAATGEWIFKFCFNDFLYCKTLDSGSDSAIHTEPGAVNTIELRAVGSLFTMFVNGKQVGQLDNSALTTGGVWLETDSAAECVFTYFKASRPK